MVFFFFLLSARICYKISKKKKKKKGFLTDNVPFFNFQCVFFFLLFFCILVSRPNALTPPRLFLLLLSLCISAYLCRTHTSLFSSCQSIRLLFATDGHSHGTMRMYPWPIFRRNACVCRLLARQLWEPRLT